jgi:hypothetical protein
LWLLQITLLNCKAFPQCLNRDGWSCRSLSILNELFTIHFFPRFNPPPLLNFYVLEAIRPFFRRFTELLQLRTVNSPLTTFISGLTGAANTVYGQARGRFRRAWRPGGTGKPPPKKHLIFALLS